MKCCVYSVQLDNTGDRSRSYVLGVMSPARFLCATPVKVSLPFTSSLTVGFCKANKLNECRRYVLIVCPRSYEPRALPLRHAGEGVAYFYVQLDVQLLQSWQSD